MVTEIPIRSMKYPGMVALVDDEDAALIRRFTWNLLVARHKYAPPTYYAVHAMRTIAEDGTPRRTTQGMHRLILACDGPVDHSDGDGLNNRRSNLRPATYSQNSANTRRIQPNAASPYRGVRWNKETSRWRAVLGFRRKYLHLGYFFDEEEAARAYDRAAASHFGEFAVLNFPEASR